MTLNEILKSHEKGLKYGHLLRDKPKYPLILDSRGEVLSFPPIINSTLTELSTETRNIFIDITGLDLDALNKTLNILTTALHDMGGRVEQVKVIYPDKILVTPNYKVKKWKIRIEYINSLLGLSLTALEVSKALRKMRHGVKIDGRTVTITPPPYRVDIMHPVDFVEDVAMGIGYDLLRPKQPQVLTYGRYHLMTRVEELVREIMIGLGYTEVMNFTLTNLVDEFERMMVEQSPHVRLLNPVSNEYSILRTWIIPSLMKTLSLNKGSQYPQRIFEVGDVIEPDSTVPERAVRKTRLGCISCHADASYSEVKSVCEEILKNLSIREWELKPYDQLPFLEGRAAKITVNSRDIGMLGEIHPQVLENWGITLPAAAIELYIHEILHLLT